MSSLFGSLATTLPVVSRAPRARRRCAAATALTVALAFLGKPASADVAAFPEPKVKGMRLDWCLYWANDCGKPAASAYCRTQGFEGALRFAIDQNVGSRGVVTVVLGDGRLCAAPTCSGFRSVTCERP
jgi:hypothetical protein